MQMHLHAQLHLPSVEGIVLYELNMLFQLPDSLHHVECLTPLAP